jgi:hypothetical protein
VRRRSARGRALSALALVALLAAVGANGSARAQTPGTGLADQFGGYKLGARGNDILVAIDAVGFVPNNPRVLQQGLPEAQATGAGGPTNYALASLDYPGSVIGDLGAIIAQASPDAPAFPNYPVQARAYFPGPPTEVRQEISGAGMVATTTDTTSDGIATYDANDLPSFLRSTGMTVHANTHLEDKRAVSQLRAEIANLDFAGILTIGSIVTDIRADTDGAKGASAGTTTVSGAKLLGLDVTIDDTGVHFPSETAPGAPTTTAKPGLLDPITSQIPLGGLADALKPIAAGLTSLITATVGAAGSINDLLEAGGISIRLLQPVGNDKDAIANRTANGLMIQMNYNPNTNAVLSGLLALIPAQQLPSDAIIPGLPINSSPQGLVSLLSQVYALTIALVPGAVDATASPPFTAPAFSPSTGGGSTGSTGSTGSSGGTTPGFSTPAPGLTSPGGGSPTLGDASPISFLGDAVPVWAAILLLLSMPLWGVASSKLADNTLAAAGASSCPEGLDSRDPPGGLT